MSFKLKVEVSGLIEVEWVDDYGQSTYKRAIIDVYDDKENIIYPFSLDKPSKIKEVM